MPGLVHLWSEGKDSCLTCLLEQLKKCLFFRVNSPCSGSVSIPVEWHLKKKHILGPQGPPKCLCLGPGSGTWELLTGRGTDIKVNYGTVCWVHSWDNACEVLLLVAEPAVCWGALRLSCPHVGSCKAHWRGDIWVRSWSISRIHWVH